MEVMPPTSMQVPRHREKGENVWTDDSWNQFLHELETGHKVSVLASRTGHTPQLEPVPNGFIPFDIPFPPYSLRNHWWMTPLRSLHSPLR